MSDSIWVASLLKDYQLPESYRLRMTHGATPYPDFIVTRLPMTALSSADNYLTWHATYFVPVTNILDPDESVPFSKISAYPLKSLDEVKLPAKALAVDGKYPGNPGYPLVNRKVLIKNSKLNDRQLLKWFHSVTPTVPPDIIWIGSVGDIMIARGVEQLLEKDGARAVFNDVLPIMRAQEFLIGNLEGAVTTASQTWPKTFTFKFNPASLKYLKEAGFDYFCLTNNHTFDYGKQGFLETIKNLRQFNFAFSGAGLTAMEASRPWETVQYGQKISILSCAAYPDEGGRFQSRRDAQAKSDRPGVLVAGEETNAIFKNIFSPSNYNIVCVHGGFEYESTPSAKQKLLYRQMIDSGADLVLGSHPHVLQGFQVYHDGLIAYSLGNFVFPGMQDFAHAEETVLLSVGIYQGRALYLNVYPVKINNKTIRLDLTGTIKKRYFKLSSDLKP